MSAHTSIDKPRRLRGGPWGPLLAVGFALVAVIFVYAYYVHPHYVRDYGLEIGYHKAMFGPKLEQPIAFSHRLHVTDKEIDCFYCHSYPERSLNAGLPSADLCLGCHNYIIPEHEEILKLKGFKDRGEDIPWVRVYYNPDHVYFPHFRHLVRSEPNKEPLACQQCHGEVETADRLNQVTFYMGFCIDCHEKEGATRDCVACHQ